MERKEQILCCLLCLSELLAPNAGYKCGCVGEREREREREGQGMITNLCGCVCVNEREIGSVRGTGT